MTLVPQIGMVELLVLGILALIVVGPKDLPKLMRSVGQLVGKVKSLANDFRSSFDEMAREAEIEEMRQQIEELKRTTGTDELRRAMKESDDAFHARKTDTASRTAPRTASGD